MLWWPSLWRDRCSFRFPRRPLGAGSSCICCSPWRLSPSRLPFCHVHWIAAQPVFAERWFWPPPAGPSRRGCSRPGSIPCSDFHFAFAILVLSRAALIACGALLPAIAPEGRSLVRANSSLSKASAIAGIIAVPLGLVILNFFDAPTELVVAAVVYVLGVVPAARGCRRLNASARWSNASRREPPRGR